MLRNLSPSERETLTDLGSSGPGGNFDIIALNKLFTLGLIEVNSDRRVVLTQAGRDIRDELEQAGVKASDGDGKIPNRKSRSR